MPVKNVGKAKPMKRQCAGDLVEDRIGPRRRIDADRQRHQQREHLRRADHGQRHRQALQDQRVDVDPADERKAPVAVQHRGQPVQVAHRDRIIEAELGAQRRLHRRRDGGIGRQLAERVAGGQRQHGEQHQADPQQARDRNEQAPDEVAAHGARLIDCGPQRSPPPLEGRAAKRPRMGDGRTHCDGLAQTPPPSPVPQGEGELPASPRPLAARLTRRDTSPAGRRSCCPSRSAARAACSHRRHDGAGHDRDHHHVLDHQVVHRDEHAPRA